MNPTLTAARVRELLDYDPEAGSLSRGGKSVGRRHKDGYVRLKVDRGNFLAHRIAWLHFYGEFPSGNLDHVNCVKDDNRISNLRVATPRQNIANKPVDKSNLCGLKGVSWMRRRRKWRARIRVNGKRVKLGEFNSKEEASSAYFAAAQRLHGEFARAA